MRLPATLDELQAWCCRTTRVLLAVMVSLGAIQLVGWLVIVPSPEPRPQPRAERQSEDGFGPGTILLALMAGLL